jgi:hypothetical protein
VRHGHGKLSRGCEIGTSGECLFVVRGGEGRDALDLACLDMDRVRQHHHSLHESRSLAPGLLSVGAVQSSVVLAGVVV